MEKNKMSLVGLSVSNEILGEIGRIAVQQSRIEAQMIILIAELSPDALKKQMSEKSKWTGKNKTLDDLTGYELEQMLVSAFNGRPEYSKEVNELQQSLKRHRQARNLFVHSMWGFGEDFRPDRATRVKPVYKPELQVKGESVIDLDSRLVTLEELHVIAEEIEKLVLLIGNLRVQATGS